MSLEGGGVRGDRVPRQLSVSEGGGGIPTAGKKKWGRPSLEPLRTAAKSLGSGTVKMGEQVMKALHLSGEGVKQLKVLGGAMAGAMGKVSLQRREKAESASGGARSKKTSSSKRNEQEETIDEEEGGIGEGGAGESPVDEEKEKARIAESLAKAKEAAAQAKRETEGVESEKIFSMVREYQKDPGQWQKEGAALVDAIKEIKEKTEKLLPALAKSQQKWGAAFNDPMTQKVDLAALRDIADHLANEVRKLGDEQGKLNARLGVIDAAMVVVTTVDAAVARRSPEKMAEHRTELLTIIEAMGATRIDNAIAAFDRSGLELSDSRKYLAKAKRESERQSLVQTLLGKTESDVKTRHLLCAYNTVVKPRDLFSVIASELKSASEDKKDALLAFCVEWAEKNHGKVAFDGAGELKFEHGSASARTLLERIATEYDCDPLRQACSLLRPASGEYGTTRFNKAVKDIPPVTARDIESVTIIRGEEKEKKRSIDAENIEKLSKKMKDFNLGWLKELKPEDFFSDQFNPQYSYTQLIAKQFDTMSAQFEDIIRKTDDVKEKTVVMRAFIKLAEVCQKNNDFFSVGAIGTAIYKTMVKREGMDVDSKSNIEAFNALDASSKKKAELAQKIATGAGNDYKRLVAGCHRKNEVFIPNPTLVMKEVVMLGESGKDVAIVDEKNVYNFQHLKNVADYCSTNVFDKKAIAESAEANKERLETNLRLLQASKELETSIYKKSAAFEKNLKSGIDEGSKLLDKMLKAQGEEKANLQDELAKVDIAIVFAGIIHGNDYRAVGFVKGMDESRLTKAVGLLNRIVSDDPHMEGVRRLFLEFITRQQRH